MNETIRRIQCRDLDQLLVLYRELAQGLDVNVEISTEVFKKIDNNPDYYLLGCFENEILLGSLMGIKCLDLAFGQRPFMIVENVIVLQSARKKGVGKKLMHYIESVAINNKSAFIQFCSSEFRKEAHQFYYNIGYEPDTIKGFRKYL